MTPPKEANKAVVTNPKEMDIYKLPDKEFKKITLNEMQENTDRQLNEIMETMHEQNKFNK